MRANLFKRGTLLIPSGPAHDPLRKHLHIICTDPDDAERQLVVSVSSVPEQGFYDPTCILQAHEHRYLKWASYVAYTFADIVTFGELEAGVARRQFIPDEDLQGQAFLKVSRGILNSNRTPLKVKRFYQAFLDRTRIAA